MNAADRRPQRVRQMAWLTLWLLVAVTCLSAYLRHSGAGLGCEPWPACFGQGESSAAGAVVVGGQALTVARAAHRVTATLALLLVMAMLVVSAARRPRLAREAALSLCLLVLALSLALLGVFTPGSRLPAVAIGNLLGGFLMLAIAARLVAPSAQRGLRAWALGVALLLLVQIALGAFTSAAYAGLACTDLRECIEQARAGGWNWAALNPWREPVLAITTPNPEGALTQWLHRLGSFVVAPLLACLGVCAWRRGRRVEAAALLCLLASQVALGLVVGSTGLPLVPVLLHNLGTALMLALVLRLA
jgi:cytochrome c oxidase assembly protein subunit 15